MTTTASTGRGGLPGLAAVQKFGRSLMLPIAALPVAALLLRLGQPDLLGADGSGWDKVAAVVGAAGGALFDNLPLALRRRRRDRHGQEGRRLHGPGRRRRLSRLQERRRGHQPVRPRPASRGRRAGAHQLRRARRHRHRRRRRGLLWQRYYRIKLPDYLAFFGGRRFVPMITAFAAIVLARADGPGVPGVRRRADQRLGLGRREQRHRRLRVRHAPTGC